MSRERKPESPRRVLMKPFEVVAISGGFGLFVAFIVFYTVKNFVLGLILGGIAMVLILMILALLLLNYKPNVDAPVYLDRDLSPDAPRIDESRDDGPGTAESRTAESGDAAADPDTK